MKFLVVDIRRRLGDPAQPQYAVKRIKDILDQREISCDLCHYDDFGVSLENGTLTIRLTTNGVTRPLSDYTHIIMRGHHSSDEFTLKKYIVSYAEDHGITVQNAQFIKLLPSYTKLAQMVMLAQAGMPFIDSSYAIDGRYWEKEADLARIGFPLIYKHIAGEYRIEVIDGKKKFKKNVFLAQNVSELESLCTKHDQPETPYISKPSNYFIQKFLNTGEDYRAIMFRGKFFSGWKRKATHNFLTVSRGEYTLYDHPDTQFKKLSEDVAVFFKADYCAIDIMYHGSKPYILEINMNPGFRAFETKVAGHTLDVAQAIVDNMVCA